jgi:hypothetical protein
MDRRIVLLLALTGCTDSTKAPPPPAPDCTQAGAEDVALTVSQVGLDGRLAPLTAAVDVTFSGCANVTTDDVGRATASVGTDVPHSVRVDGDGFLTTIFAERAITPASASESFYLFPSEFAASPTYSADAGMIVVTVAPTLRVGACGGGDGVSLALRDHPELTPTYLSAVTTPAAGATATTTYGVTVFSGVPPGERYEVIATKPGCLATTLDAAGVGLVPTEAGAISVVAATIAPPACGPGPYVAMTGTIDQRAVADYSLAIAAGVQVTWSTCPGVATTTDATGRWGAQVTANLPFDLTLEKSGLIPYRYQELVLAADSDGMLVMRGDDWKPDEPGWSDTGVTIYALVGASGTGACATSDGVTLAIHGHPEATAHYLDTNVPPQEAAGATATTARGYAELTGLAPGRYELDATTSKACKVVTLAGNATGFVDAVAGTENILVVTLEDP